ncbi:unnamed protein product [Acanthoscelides obtectus]|uniref:Uncharacterized protein n=1 Tax=Acanthoscelides obtectus TaxID=200917 RepID=A0A9P0M784_ACAOB|nr:unnamed protein product [Acanthoscelides obtectus]CAK1623098.1 hypothetical protein AOBTE_LOCUS1809 [Acanthoscelides obtectus]
MPRVYTFAQTVENVRNNSELLAKRGIDSGFAKAADRHCQISINLLILGQELKDHLTRRPQQTHLPRELRSVIFRTSGTRACRKSRATTRKKEGKV